MIRLFQFHTAGLNKNNKGCIPKEAIIYNVNEKENMEISRAECFIKHNKNGEILDITCYLMCKTNFYFDKDIETCIFLPEDLLIDNNKYYSKIDRFILEDEEIDINKYSDMNELFYNICHRSLNMRKAKKSIYKEIIIPNIEFKYRRISKIDSYDGYILDLYSYFPEKINKNINIIQIAKNKGDVINEISTN